MTWTDLNECPRTFQVGEKSGMNVKAPSQKCSMNVLFCNKYFFLNGGTEKYLQSMLHELSALGHTAIPFSVRYANSWPSPYSEYFLNPPGSSEETHFKHLRLGLFNAIRYLDRSIYSLDARKALSRFLDRLQTVHVAYLLNIYNYMSPSIIHTLKKHDIPVVLRLGDYNLLCPSYLFLRKGKPCQLCMKGDYFHGVRYRCVKGSFAVSAVRVAGMYLQHWLRVYHLVDAFVVPSDFMRQCLVAGGFPARRIHVMRTPVHQPLKLPEVKRNHVLYFGRIAFEKGLDTLVTAYQRSGIHPHLILAGNSFDGEQERLRRLVLPEWQHRIHFVGFQEGDRLLELVAGALFSVVPSRWYDNAPQSICESLACGTPVLASQIGAIPEQVQDGVTGRLFTSDCEEELLDALRWMASDPRRLEQMGQAGRRFIAEHHSMHQHLKQLLGLFSGLAIHESQIGI
jgi:glycosyltransferase involved in cell wall biosynthesis